MCQSCACLRRLYWHLRMLWPELSGQHCLGPVLVRFLSGFSGKFCLVSVRCPDFVRIRCPLSVCPDFVCRDSVRYPDSVSIFRKSLWRCPDFYCRCPLNSGCDADLNAYDVNSTCIDFEGGYSCECPTGYSDDGIKCTDTNECGNPENVPARSTCTNIDVSIVITCNTGFQMTDDQWWFWIFFRNDARWRSPWRSQKFTDKGSPST